MASAPRFEDVDAFREWYAALPEPRPEAEVLLIKRAVNPRDRWSGQIALPGGRSAPGEDDRACVEREFREELGVELGSGLAGRVACLGRLDDRLVRTRTPFAVATFVFLQLDLAPTEFRLAPLEVAEALWVPARRLCGPDSRIECLQLPLESLTLPPSSAAVRVARLLGVRALFFPCINLLGGGDGGARDPGYALWGLTFGVVSDLLRAVSLPSFADRRPTELREVHRGLSCRDAPPFLSDSRLMNALLPMYFSKGPGPRRRGALLLAAATGGLIGAALLSVRVLACQRRARL